ncbi:MAG: adenylosuccinate synthetase [archaeon]
MSRKVVLISGPIGSGKSTLAKNLEKKFGATIVKTSNIIRHKKSVDRSDRLSLQKKGDELDQETYGRWILDSLSEIIRKIKTEDTDDAIFVIDSIRISNQINHIRHAYSSVVHIHLTAPSEVLKERYQKRAGKKPNIPAYETVKKNKTEEKIEDLAEIADVVINTKRCKEDDVFVRAACRLALFGKNENGYIDVIVGAQFGSEGKGQIAGYLAKEYDLLIRVGGPNAGHKVYEEPRSYTHHHLPSGTRKCDANLLLAPGMVINVNNLLKEISECKVGCDRLSIDPQVMVINERDIKNEEKRLKDISSTCQGVGNATARKILHRKPKKVKLAKDIPQLKPYIEPAIDVVMKALANNQRILVEGTQGTWLSIYHGYYPHVTSRDTTVAGCLSEAGLPPTRVRRVIMVCRTYPIRVEGPSGPMRKEITWKEISQRSKIPEKELLKREKTSTTHRQRRVGEFNWELLKKSAFINGATDIALNFVDYLSEVNRSAMRFEQLDKDTIDLIEEIEHVSKARVSLIGTGFNSRSIIDRRKW